MLISGISHVVLLLMLLLLMRETTGIAMVTIPPKKEFTHS
jgi:hypothetical protein